jgi:tripeptide aminopeptidase
MKHIAKGILMTAAAINTLLAAQAQDKKYVSEMKALADKAKVKKAFQAITDMQPQTLSDHILLTEIPAPPPRFAPPPGSPGQG